MSDLRRLSQLAPTYFHQDFDYEAPTPDGVVLVFLDDIGPGGTLELLAEIGELLASELDDGALAELWMGFGAYFDPRDPETTAHAPTRLLLLRPGLGSRSPDP